MIDSIALVNFRKVRNETMRFTGGLNVIRGANESSKSTRVEAISYALFGAKALRNSLAETVTWGERDSTLKVEAVLTIGGVTYTFKRSKSGAECTWQGKMVTGQTEVSDFATSLLGVDPVTAGKLMLASQGALRGALDAGPKATSELIEGLANFDLFEEIIEKMQEKLTLGSTAPAESRIAEAEAALDAFVSLPVPDVEALKEKIEVLTGEIGRTQEWLTREGKPDELRTAAELQNANYRQAQADAALQRLAAAEETLATRTKQHLVAVAAAAVKPDPQALPALQARLDQATHHESRKAVHDKLVSLQSAYTGDIWDGDAASLATEIASVEALGVALGLEAATILGDMKEASARMVTTSHCGFCNQDVSQFPEVARVNAECAATVERGTARRKEITGLLKATDMDAAAMKRVQTDAKPLAELAVRYPELIRTENGNVPPTCTWIGGPVVLIGSVADIKAKMADVKAKQAEAERYVMRAEALAEALVEDQQRIEEGRAAVVANPPAADVAFLTRAAQAAADKRATHDFYLSDWQIQKNRAEAEITSMTAAYAEHLTRKAELALRLAQAKIELVDLNFHNTLLKKIRAARPIISDKLWNSVLSAVSTMFSQMRGDVSVVTKGKDGFAVNGSAFSSLSGSTLDLLGLAIRIALVKTFIPRCSFMILDEPFSACDEERSARMLGFISAAGFNQTVVITHEENSEAVADTLIYL